MSNPETCIECDSETGRAGMAEDSIHCSECASGPYCEECWGKLERELCGSCEEKLLLTPAHQLQARIDELEGIVGKLTKTKDDIPVVPGVDKVFWSGDVLGPDLILIDATVALDVGLGGCVLYRGYRVFDRNGHAVLVSDSYSTTEAAEVAEAEKKPA